MMDILPTMTAVHKSPDAGRGRFDARVIENRAICREHYLLRLRLPATFPATAPGQFVQLGCRAPNGAADARSLHGGELEWSPDRPPVITQMELREPTPLLRRPFSLAGRGDGVNGPWIDIIYRVVGAGTAWLETLKPGDAADLIGPLGNRFALPKDKSYGLLVGGGVGLPPMFYLADGLHAAAWRGVGITGAMTRDLLAATLEGDAVGEFVSRGLKSVVTTDDGSFGIRGRVTEGLERVIGGMSAADRREAVVFTCGPDAMMRAVARMAAEAGIDCQVCLEQAMACGMGTCQSCIVRIEDEANPHGRSRGGRPWRYRLTCTDGPVFDARQVVWSDE